MDFNVAHLLVWYVVLIFSLTCHEFAHGYAAYRGGDLTAYSGGMVSLDPLPHIQRSPFGMVVVPLVSYVFGGWMIGWASVPFDRSWGIRHPTRQAVMSLAGPLTNLLLALVAVGLVKLLVYFGVFQLPTTVFGFTRMVELPDGTDQSSPLGAIAMALSIMMNLNLLLGIFNLIPVPPLDGAGVVQGLWPRSAGRLIDWFQEIPMAGVVGILIAWNLIGYVAGPVLRLVYQLL